MSVHFEATQDATDSFAEITGVRVYTEAIAGVTRIAYRFEETGGRNCDIKVQGTIDRSNWLDLTLLDETGSDHSSATISVSASGSDQAFVLPVANNNATGALQEVNAGYAQYRVMIKEGTGTGTATLKAHAYAKD